MTIRKIFPLVFIFLLFAVPTVNGQDKDTGDEIARLIRNGNSRELARHFNASVQLTLPDDEGRFSRTQAELIIRNFFSKYPPKSYVINHQGSSSDGSRYYIGVYKSANTTFRSYYLLKQVSEKALIHQLRFEDDN
jgi:hypothetical protein